MQVRVLLVPVGIRTGKERLKKKEMRCAPSASFSFTQAHCNNILAVALSELHAVYYIVVNPVEIRLKSPYFKIECAQVYKCLASWRNRAYSSVLWLLLLAKTRRVAFMKI